MPWSATAVMLAVLSVATSVQYLSSAIAGLPHHVAIWMQCASILYLLSFGLMLRDSIKYRSDDFAARIYQCCPSIRLHITFLHASQFVAVVVQSVESSFHVFRNNIYMIEALASEPEP
ncbi:hypothetical protein DFS33DRAFT_1286480 [Desarmillaria ectypa]|nr:hypothetical protein DFS33DRAFT_1286480 [Desarmillaria ectypa]